MHDSQKTPRDMRDPTKNHEKKASPAFKIACYQNPKDIKKAWLALEQNSTCTVFESYHWCQSWCVHGAQGAHETPLLILGTDQDNRPAFLFPMALVQTKGVITLTWLAQNYSSYNMALCRDDLLEAITKEVLLAIFEDVREQGFAFDTLILTGQPEKWDGKPHIMQAFDCVDAQQRIGLTIPLQPPFEEMHATKVSKSTRKKLRSKRRQLEKSGVVRFGQAQTAQHRKQLYKLFLDYKAVSLAAQEKPNVYEQDFLNDFFYSLIEQPESTDTEGNDPPSTSALEHFYLSVDDEVLALSYGLYFKDVFFGISRAMLDSPLSRFSPGILLLMGELEATCAHKAKTLDLGPGDSVYKKHWGYDEVLRFDCHHAFSLKGKLYLKAHLAQLKIIETLKSNETTKALGGYTKRTLHALKNKK